MNAFTPADAKLIAAAPELYSELNSCVMALKLINLKSSTPELEALINKACHALEKAS